MTMTAGVERGLRTAVLEFTREAVSELYRRGLLTSSVDDALTALNLSRARRFQVVQKHQRSVRRSRRQLDVRETGHDCAMLRRGGE